MTTEGIIKLRRNAAPGTVPADGVLAAAEPAVNIDDDQIRFWVGGENRIAREPTGGPTLFPPASGTSDSLISTALSTATAVRLTAGTYTVAATIALVHGKHLIMDPGVRIVFTGSGPTNLFTVADGATVHLTGTSWRVSMASATQSASSGFVVYGDAYCVAYVTGCIAEDCGFVGGSVSVRMATNSITPEAFGALGDGVTDDAPAIQAAIDAMETLGGGEVALRGCYYAVSSPIDMKTGVALVGPLGGQFDSQTVTTIRATSSFSGAAIIQGIAAKYVRLARIRIEGTLRHELDFINDSTMVGGSSGVGEHGILMQETGSLVLDYVTSRFCDGASLVLDGSWQTWITGGFFQFCNGGGIVIDSLLSNRKVSQCWIDRVNIQKNRIAGLWLRDRGDGTSAEHDGLLNPSQVHVTEGIIEFSFDAVDDSTPSAYDPNFLGLVVAECGYIELRGTHIAPGSTIDVATYLINLGTPTAASFNDTAFRMEGGALFGFDANAIVGFRSSKVSRAEFAGSLVTLNGTKNVIEIDATKVPFCTPVFDKCTHVRFGTSRSSIRPLDQNDVLVNGAAGEAAIDLAARVGFINSPNLRFGQLTANAGDTVSAGGTFVRDVAMFPTSDRSTALEVYHVDQTNQWTDVDLGDLTVSVAHRGPGIARVTYSNATGSPIDIPACTVMVRGWRDAYRYAETARRSADLSLQSISAGASVTGTLTAIGVELGDFVEASYSAALPTGMHLRAQVTASSTITWEIINHTAGALDRPAGYVLVRMRKV